MFDTEGTFHDSPFLAALKKGDVGLGDLDELSQHKDKCWNCGSNEFVLAGEFGLVCASCHERQEEE